MQTGEESKSSLAGAGGKTLGGCLGLCVWTDESAGDEKSTQTAHR